MLKKLNLFILLLFLTCFSEAGFSQGNVPDNTRNEIAFISDTQEPMTAEKIFLKSDHNTLATKLLFHEITNQKPTCLFILGDVVSLGYKEKKWKAMDEYLAAARSNGVPVYAALGNHDIMGNGKKGETAFSKRFPDYVNTGYIKIVDSVAIVLLNSNFDFLGPQKQKEQQDFYIKTLQAMDADPGIKCVIVTCHHAPYSNSAIVGSNKSVQQLFIPPFYESKKAKLFITGHAHDFECFQLKGKYFLTLGGGGGLHQPLNKGKDALPNVAIGYEPEFHYLLIKRSDNQLNLSSQKLKKDFSGFETGYSSTLK